MHTIQSVFKTEGNVLQAIQPLATTSMDIPKIAKMILVVLGQTKSIKGYNGRKKESSSNLPYNNFI